MLFTGVKERSVGVSLVRMQRSMSYSATSNNSLATHWPDAAAADDDDDGDISQVKTRSAWTLSDGRHSGMFNVTILRV